MHVFVFIAYLVFKTYHAWLKSLFRNFGSKGISAKKEKYKLSAAATRKSSSEDPSWNQITLSNHSQLLNKDTVTHAVDFNAYENRERTQMVEPVYIRPTIDHRRRTNVTPNLARRVSKDQPPLVNLSHPKQLPDRHERGSNFLEEVETCLPKRRNKSRDKSGAINSTPPAEWFASAEVKDGRDRLRDASIDNGYTSLPTRKSSREEVQRQCVSCALLSCFLPPAS